MKAVGAGGVALVMIVASFALWVPGVGAVDVGCNEVDGGNEAVIVAPPNGLTLNFTPDCVIVNQGGTLLAQGADPSAAHGLTSGCFSTGNLVAGTSTAVSFAFDGEFLAWTTIASTSGAPSGGECGIGEVLTRDDGREVPVLAIGDDVVTLNYQCLVHGSQMSGKIVIPL